MSFRLVYASYSLSLKKTDLINLHPDMFKTTCLGSQLQFTFFLEKNKIIVM